MADEIKDEGTSHASINLPEFKKWGPERFYDYSRQISDYDDLKQLGIAITHARVALFKIGEQINKYERVEKTAKLTYDRAYRRAYIASAEKTEAQKRMKAELACEALENEHLMAEQLKKELDRMSYTMRLELQTLQAIGNNLRQQMKME